MRLAIALVLGIFVVSCSRGGTLPFAARSFARSANTDRARAGGTYKLLYSFRGDTDAEYPQGFLSAVNGSLYGLGLGGSHSGCTNCGTVFAVSMAGQEHIVYSFTLTGNAGNGIGYGGLVNIRNKLYGTTTGGGSQSGGTLFRLSAGGAIIVLAAFKRNVNANESPLSFGATFFGTTVQGGIGCPNNGCGTIFKLGPLGIQEIHRFKGYPNDGFAPHGSLTALNSVLYGTTTQGGNGYGCAISGSGCGTIFSVTPSGKERVLYNFKGGAADGSYPVGGLLNFKGTLYGLTVYGGNAACNGGCGTVFSVTPSGKERIVYLFSGTGDGAYPNGGLAAINGTFYGTTSVGGAQCAPSGRCGNVFAVTPSGTERVTYAFKGGRDGRNPDGGLLALNGKLYGTTSNGGSGCYSNGRCGSVFEIAP